MTDEPKLTKAVRRLPANGAWLFLGRSCPDALFDADSAGLAEVRMGMLGWSARLTDTAIKAREQGNG